MNSFYWLANIAFSRIGESAAYLPEKIIVGKGVVPAKSMTFARLPMKLAVGETIFESTFWTEA